MVLREYLPSPPLSEFVASIYCIKGDMGWASREILPDFKTDLIFIEGTGVNGKIGDSGEYRISGPFINGFRRESLHFSYQGFINLLGVRFLPYGFTRIFGIPHQEITGFLPLSEVLNYPNTAEINDKIFSAPDPEEMIRRVISWLLKVIASAEISNTLPIRAINRISSTRGTIPLQEICNNSHSEYKQLQRFCHKNLDICPKFLSRMIRFEYLHESMRHSGRPDWISLVTSHGFTDQSHLIREVRQFTGLTPGEFHASRETFI